MVQRRPSARPIKFTLRFYPSQDDDLIRWLDELGEDRLGVKNQAVKERLRMTVGTELPQTTVAESALDLVKVRQVVEAAVASALGRFQSACALQGKGQVVGAVSTTMAEEDDEVEGLLDMLEQTLVLGGEDL